MATQKIHLKIGGMECPNCAMILERIEDKVAGVTQAEASYHKNSLMVVYDDAQVDRTQIEAEVRRLGYKVL